MNSPSLCAGLVAAAAVLSGCADDTAQTTNTGPTGTPTLAFTNPASGGDPPCVSIGDDAAGRIPLVVTVTELVLRPPGACGAFVQCGHLQLLTGNVVNNESAVPAVELLLRKLADPIHDGQDGDFLDVTVQAVDDAGEPFVGEDGMPLTDGLSLITVPDCSALP